jgi:cholesterol transport system auxiliary component
MNHTLKVPQGKYRPPWAKVGGNAWLFILVALALGACSALPDKPVRAAMYDFGPGPLQAMPVAGTARLPALALAEIESSISLDSTAILFRLAYADAQQLQPYALARWSMPPAQLFQQRLRDTLSRSRVVLHAGEGPALNRGENQGVLPPVLRLELEEFSQLFDAPARSVGLVRLRATLVQVTVSGDKLLAQRSFTLQSPAPSPDAAGGVRALTAASDAAVMALDEWLSQQP